jgi:hypothetical protein
MTPLASHPRLDVGGVRKRQRKGAVDDHELSTVAAHASADTTVTAATCSSTSTAIVLLKNNKQEKKQGKRKYDKRVMLWNEEGQRKTINVPRIVKSDPRRQYLTMLANVLNGVSTDFPWFVNFLQQFGDGYEGDRVVLTKQLLFSPQQIAQKKKLHRVSESSSSTDTGKRNAAMIMMDETESLSITTSSSSTTSSVSAMTLAAMPSIAVTVTSATGREEVVPATVFVKPWPPYQTEFGPHSLPDSYQEEYKSSSILPPLQENGICLVGSESITRYWGILAQIMPDFLTKMEDVKIVTRAGSTGCYLVSTFSCTGTEIYDLDYFDMLEDLQETLTSGESAGSEREGQDAPDLLESDAMVRNTVQSRLPAYFYDPVAIREKVTGQPVASKVSPLRVQGLCYLHINEEWKIKAIDFRVVVPSNYPSTTLPSPPPFS